MEKTEFNIGEEFQLGLSRMKCVAQREDKCPLCDDCFFNDWGSCDDVNSNIVGPCSMGSRTDKHDVIFIKL